jgi:hypothetical protein
MLVLPAIPNFLRPLRHDVLVVSVTVWLSGQSTDAEGNVIVNPRATPIVLQGWDIQPIPSTLPASFSPAGGVEGPNNRRAFVPRDQLQYIAAGDPVKNNVTNEEYRISGVRDWGSHLELYLEVAN